MSTGKINLKLLNELEQLELSRPSIIRISPLTYLARLLFAILSLTFLVVFISTFTGPLWERFYEAMTSNKYSDNSENMKLLLGSTRIFSSIVFIVTAIGYNQACLVLNRNKFILNFMIWTDELKKELKNSWRQDIRNGVKPKLSFSLSSPLYEKGSS